MLFDKSHTMFMLISAITITVLLVLFVFFVKQQKHRDLILKISALVTVILHFSSLYVDFFTTGTANAEGPMLLPLYPCNIAMWLLLICAFIKNKKSKTFAILAEFTFYLGVVGGIFGIMLNEIYINTPNLADWGVLKGLLSHATMLLGCIYLLTGRYIKIRVYNVISVAIGLVGMLLNGYILIGLYNAFNQTPPNIMFLLESPVPSIDWINTYIIGLAGLLLVFIITAIVEQFRPDKQNIWYKKIFKKENNK